jgi:hypothetical protein
MNAGAIFSPVMRNRMTPRALVLLVGCCFAAACADLPPGGAGLGDSCLATSDCVSPYICISGRCAPSSGQLCTPSQYRCNGDNVEQCSQAGDAWEKKEECAIACVQGACQPPVCAHDDQKCEGNTIMQCLPNGAGWVYVQTCVTSCTQDVADARKSICAAPDCTPFQTQCSATSANVLETCNSNGTGWNPSPCGSNKTCLQGQCVTTQCTATAQRCNGSVAEACNDTGTQWVPKPDGYCQNGCVMQSGVASCPAQICVPFATHCRDDATVETCNSFGTAWISPTTCTTQAALGAVCVSGACRDEICVPGKQRCTESLVQQCNDSGTAWDNQQTCPFACVSTGASTAGCAPAACAAGQERCCQPGDAACLSNGPVLQICTPDRSGFAFVQYCATGCALTANTTPQAAACKTPVCPPLDRTCGTDPATGQPAVQVCLADGTGRQEVELCAQGCAAGSCTSTDTACTPGEYRCQRDEVQSCARLSDQSVQWEFVDHCLGGCSEGVCLQGGACGCSPATAATSLASSCAGGGVGAPVPISLNLMQAANTTPNAVAAPLPCNDGSTFIVYTSPIVGSNGVKVPDGTMVTFTNDSTSGTTDSLIMSADADPGTPGLQRPTRDGIALAIVAAPTQATCQTVNSSTQAVTLGSRTVTVSATIAGSCAGRLPIYFASSTGTTKVNYIAEDFSSTTNEDRLATTGIWDTSISAAGAVPPFDLGTCADGDFPTSNLTLPSGSFDLQASTNLMPTWDVASFTNQSATVNGVVSSVRPGDEVIVATIWGPAGSTGPGTYEFHHVATVDNTSGFGQITFTEPVGVVYGNGTNAVLTGHRVVLQRVPQFRDVSIPPSTVLTSSAVTVTGGVPTGGTGILAFRACRLLTINNIISMDQKGLPVGLSAPTTGATTSLNRFLLGPPAASGSGATASGGGVIFIAAGTINFTSSSAKVTASATSGGGGMVWLAAPTMRFSAQTRVFATGGLTGMARLDTSAPDWSLSAPSPTPMSSTLVPYASNGGRVGPVLVQSGRVYSEPASTGKLVRTAQLTGLIGGSGSTAAVFQLASGATQLIPGVNLSVTSDGYSLPPTWFSLDSGTATIAPLRQPGDVRFRLSLAPPTDKELLVRAVAFSVTVQ